MVGDTFEFFAFHTNLVEMTWMSYLESIYKDLKVSDLQAHAILAQMDKH